MTITGPIRRSIVSRRKCRQGLRCRARRGRGAAITPRRGRCARVAASIRQGVRSSEICDFYTGVSASVPYCVEATSREGRPGFTVFSFFETPPERQYTLHAERTETVQLLSDVRGETLHARGHTTSVLYTTNACQCHTNYSSSLSHSKTSALAHTDPQNTHLVLSTVALSRYS